MLWFSIRWIISPILNFKEPTGTAAADTFSRNVYRRLIRTQLFPLVGECSSAAMGLKGLRVVKGHGGVEVAKVHDVRKSG